MKGSMEGCSFLPLPSCPFYTPVMLIAIHPSDSRHPAFLAPSVKQIGNSGWLSTHNQNPRSSRDSSMSLSAISTPNLSAISIQSFKVRARQTAELLPPLGNEMYFCESSLSGNLMGVSGLNCPSFPRFPVTGSQDSTYQPGV